MRSYDEAWAAARDRRAFSNGTEGYAWTGEWCDTCVRDRGTRLDAGHPDYDETGCPLLMVALLGRTPVEWVEQPWEQVKGEPEGVVAPVLGGTYECSEYLRDPDTDDDDDQGGGGDPDPDPDPGPPPVIEGQTDLFEQFFDQWVDQVDGRAEHLAGAGRR